MYIRALQFGIWSAATTKSSRRLLLLQESKHKLRTRGCFVIFTIQRKEHTVSGYKFFVLIIIQTKKGYHVMTKSVDVHCKAAFSARPKQQNFVVLRKKHAKPITVGKSY